MGKKKCRTVKQTANKSRMENNNVFFEINSGLWN